MYIYFCIYTLDFTRNDGLNENRKQEAESNNKKNEYNSLFLTGSTRGGGGAGLGTQTTIHPELLVGLPRSLLQLPLDEVLDLVHLLLLLVQQVQDEAHG